MFYRLTQKYQRAWSGFPGLVTWNLFKAYSLIFGAPLFLSAIPLVGFTWWSGNVSTSLLYEPSVLDYVLAYILFCLVLETFAFGFMVFQNGYIFEAARHAMWHDWKESGRQKGLDRHVESVILLSGRRRGFWSRLLFRKPLSQAGNENGSCFLLCLFLWHPAIPVAEEAAANPRTPRWAKSLAARRSALCTVFVEDPHCETSWLERIVSDKHTPTDVLVDVAGHRSASTEVLRKVWSHRNGSFRAELEILRNPECPREIMERAVAPEQRGCEWLHVVRSLVLNKNCPPEALSVIANEAEDREVLGTVARHPQAPENAAILAALRASG